MAVCCFPQHFGVPDFLFFYFYFLARCSPGADLYNSLWLYAKNGWCCFECSRWLISAHHGGVRFFCGATKKYIFIPIGFETCVVHCQALREDVWTGHKELYWIRIREPLHIASAPSLSLCARKRKKSDHGLGIDDLFTRYAFCVLMAYVLVV